MHLTKGGGQQFAPEFRALNPDALMPVLDDDGRVLTQSLAIIEYLDETHPEPPLLPRDALDRAYVRAFALTIACEIHPLNNLRVLRYLVQQLGVERGREERLVPALGRDRAWPRWRRARGRRPRSGAMCWATGHAGRLSCWCRRSSMRVASIAGSITCRR